MTEEALRMKKNLGAIGSRLTAGIPACSPSEAADQATRRIAVQKGGNKRGKFLLTGYP